MLEMEIIKEAVQIIERELKQKSLDLSCIHIQASLITSNLKLIKSKIQSENK